MSLTGFDPRRNANRVVFAMRSTPSTATARSRSSVGNAHRGANEYN
jgi:hypothetical protein